MLAALRIAQGQQAPTPGGGNNDPGARAKAKEQQMESTRDLAQAAPAVKYELVHQGVSADQLIAG